MYFRLGRTWELRRTPARIIESLRRGGAFSGIPRKVAKCALAEPSPVLGELHARTLRSLVRLLRPHSAIHIKTKPRRIFRRGFLKQVVFLNLFGLFRQVFYYFSGDNKSDYRWNERGTAGDLATLSAFSRRVGRADAIFSTAYCHIVNGCQRFFF